MKVNEQYQVKNSNRFASLENVMMMMMMMMIWTSIRLGKVVKSI
jgi:hypothetical protein